MIKYFFIVLTTLIGIGLQAQNNGTVRGSAVRAADVPQAHSANINSVSFDGDSGRITSTAVIILGPTSSLSIWFKINIMGPEGKMLASKSDNGNSYIQILDSVTVRVQTEVGYTYVDFAVPEIAKHTWYNLIMVRNAGITHVYLNGVQSATGGLSQPTHNIAINQLGEYWHGGYDQYFYNMNGKLAELRIFNTALSSADIANLVNGQPPGTQSSLHWKMNEASGNTNVIDYPLGSTGGTGGGGSGNTTNSQWITAGNNIYYSSGNVGIGTANLSDPGYKLFVENGIRTRKLKVDAPATQWPDYVFYKDYKLPTLEEIEKSIKLNNHLPGIPSASDIKKNGIDVAENQALLLKKIEELTLYLIQQNKKQLNMQTLIDQQNKRIKKLERKAP